MEHYYTLNPKSPHDIQHIEYTLRGLNMQFYTDSGVFSRERVDFGSHCLLKALPSFSGSILDLGCGYGAIGITLAALNPDSAVLMTDVNERAVELTRRNILFNSVKNANAQISDGFSSVQGCFEAIVCNPPIRAGKEVIYSWFEHSIDFLTPGGAIYLVIQKKQGAPSAVKKLESVYGSCDILEKEGGYWILCGKKTL